MEETADNNAATKTITTIKMFVAECSQFLPEIKEKPLKTWFWLIIKYQRG